MFEIMFIALLNASAALALPGPSLIAVASSALSRGRYPALLIASGISLGVLSWVLLMAFGLGLVFQSYPLMIIALKLLGGSYLVWLSLKIFWAILCRKSIELSSACLEPNAWNDFRYGMLIVLTNPAAALMWATVASFLFGFGLTTWQVVALGPVFSLVALMIYGSYAIVFSTGAAFDSNRKFWRITETVFGGVFGALGSWLIADAMRDIEGA